MPSVAGPGGRAVPHAIFRACAAGSWSISTRAGSSGSASGSTRARGPRYNTAPTQLVPVVVERDGKRELRFMRWGLVPYWVDDPSVGSRMINARAETVATKPSFREAFRWRRCLIPADAFYEWQQVPGARRKQPYAIGLADGEPFAFAGLWETWQPPEGGEAVETCAIITCPPTRSWW